MILGNTTGEVAGWGISTATGTSSRVLMHAEMPTVTNELCWDTFQTAARELNRSLDGLELTENKFCAGDR